MEKQLGHAIDLKKLGFKSFEHMVSSLSKGRAKGRGKFCFKQKEQASYTVDTKSQSSDCQPESNQDSKKYPIYKPKAQPSKVEQTSAFP